jgi:orotidine-5'-phosphate decarboxylase
MEETVNYIPDTHFKIADAKRGDIGNTSAQYAKAFFETLNFDAITVAPYMGEDSIKPFLEFKDKWTIVLGLTSNPGAVDFELKQIAGAPPSGITFEKSPEDPGSRESKCLYHHVLQTVSGWGSEENLMFVIGATNTDQFNEIRHLTPNHFFLVPGVGAQGGSLQQVSKMAMIRDCGLLVNASRAIIYASNGEDFAEAAATAAGDYAAEMKVFLQTYSR